MMHSSSPGTHQLHYPYTEYDDNELDATVLRIAFVLEGREDTAEVRELYRQHQENQKSKLDWTPILHNNLLYPRWFVQDVYALREQHPMILRAFLATGFELSQLPELNQAFK